MKTEYHRNRISLTLNDAEFSEVQKVATILGVKPTQAIFEAWRVGMPLVVEQHNQRRQKLQFAELISSQVDWTDKADKKKSR